uniref:Uncharacterized protein n=1 Tax=Rhizophora mucronata TaxID=61149 RepID=A0A2P2NVQ9_RHIMU
MKAVYFTVKFLTQQPMMY